VVGEGGIEQTGGRRGHRIARMGVDSLAVLVLYALGVAGLFAVARAS